MLERKKKETGEHAHGPDGGGHGGTDWFLVGKLGSGWLPAGSLLSGATVHPCSCLALHHVPRTPAGARPTICAHPIPSHAHAQAHPCPIPSARGRHRQADETDIHRITSWPVLLPPSPIT